MCYFIILFRWYLASKLLLRSLKPFWFLLYSVWRVYVFCFSFLFSPLFLSFLPLSLLKSLKALRIVLVSRVRKFYNANVLVWVFSPMVLSTWPDLSVWKHLFNPGIIFLNEVESFFPFFPFPPSFFLSQTPLIGIMDLFDQSSNFLSYFHLLFYFYFLCSTSIEFSSIIYLISKSFYFCSF